MHEKVKKHILEYAAKNMRFDGRKLEEYRKIEVQRGVSSTAEGSAIVKIGETEVMAGVKMLIEKPYPDTPDQGSLMVGVEMLPMSNPAFESGPPSRDAIELARVVDRGVRESKAVDFKSLMIEHGAKVWIVSIDVVTINDAGNLFDASALATIAAIMDTKYPVYDGTAIDYRTKTDQKLPLNKIPVSVTVIKIGNNFFIDPTEEEASAIDARLTVATTADGTICALQKGGDEELSIEEIEIMINLGIKKGAELRGYLG